MLANGYSKSAIKALWDILVPFSDYAFNKAHAAAYGLVSYWTAYLKANYPAEYMAALLTSVKDDKDKMAIYLNECRRMKIQVLPPDVNESDATFTPVGGDIRFGLTAIRNVGANVVDKIVEARQEQSGSPTSTTSWPRCRRWSATSGSSSRWSRAAPSTTWATGAGRWSRSTSRPSTSTSRPSATRRSARTPCSAASTTRTPASGWRSWSPRSRSGTR